MAEIMADGVLNIGPFLVAELLLVVGSYGDGPTMRSTDLPVEGPASKHALG